MSKVPTGRGPELADLVSLIDASGNTVAFTDNKVPVHVVGSKVAEQLTEAHAENNVLTFSEELAAVEIYHAEDTRQEFIVNGVTLYIPPGTYRTPVDGVASAEVTVPADVDCIVSRLV